MKKISRRIRGKDKVEETLKGKNKIEKAVKDNKEETNTKISKDYAYLILSEFSLKGDWLSTEEEKAWKDL
ncbi:hypothetical protein [Persephonella sp.]|uniref:hypothetical protein n=1 Tax=Persephonella sp. TaxID=2060922 RepID=UPI002600032E|nr:hypothetical protein [Persephonella sp.]